MAMSDAEIDRLVEALSEDERRAIVADSSSFEQWSREMDPQDRQRVIAALAGSDEGTAESFGIDPFDPLELGGGLDAGFDDMVSAAAAVGAQGLDADPAEVARFTPPRGTPGGLGEDDPEYVEPTEEERTEKLIGRFQAEVETSQLPERLRATWAQALIDADYMRPIDEMQSSGDLSALLDDVDEAAMQAIQDVQLAASTGSAGYYVTPAGWEKLMRMTGTASRQDATDVIQEMPPIQLNSVFNKEFDNLDRTFYKVGVNPDTGQDITIGSQELRTAQQVLPTLSTADIEDLVYIGEVEGVDWQLMGLIAVREGGIEWDPEATSELGKQLGVEKESRQEQAAYYASLAGKEGAMLDGGGADEAFEVAEERERKGVQEQARVDQFEAIATGDLSTGLEMYDSKLQAYFHTVNPSIARKMSEDPSSLTREETNQIADELDRLDPMIRGGGISGMSTRNAEWEYMENISDVALETKSTSTGETPISTTNVIDVQETYRDVFESWFPGADPSAGQMASFTSWFTGAETAWGEAMRADVAKDNPFAGPTNPFGKGMSEEQMAAAEAFGAPGTVERASQIGTGAQSQLRGTDLYTEYFQNKPLGMSEEAYNAAFENQSRSLFGAAQGSLNVDERAAGMKTGDTRAVGQAGIFSGSAFDSSTFRGRLADFQNVFKEMT